MAVKKKKRKKDRRFIYRFELGLGGLAGLGAVAFCVFLWMFLLGVWAGQTVLQSGDDLIMASPRQPGSKKNIQREPPPAANVEIDDDVQLVDDLARAEEEAAAANDTSFFSLQIAAYHDPAGAKQTVKKWQRKGYAAFLRAPENDDDKFTRVYIGKFENLAAANKKAQALKKSDDLPSFVALLTTAATGTP